MAAIVVMESTAQEVIEAHRAGKPIDELIDELEEDLEAVKAKWTDD